MGAGLGGGAPLQSTALTCKGCPAQSLRVEHGHYSPNIFSRLPFLELSSNKIDKIDKIGGAFRRFLMIMSEEDTYHSVRR